MTTKKDYIAIAQAIKESEQYEDKRSIRLSIATKLASHFEQDNKRFDTERFLDACNVK